mgnify:CR=1 FL=1
MRIHQWSKNLILFVPLIATTEPANYVDLTAAAFAFFAFSFCSSSSYLLNDIFDIENDKSHPRKRNRAFAASLLSTFNGKVVASILALLGITMSTSLSMNFSICLIIYLILTSFYSIVLKKIVLIDCMTLTFLYTLRLVAGAIAFEIFLSFWLLAFSIFFFLSLAFLKRYSEIQNFIIENGNQILKGRGYETSDSILVLNLGTISGFSSLIILSFYINGESVTNLYQIPEIIWISLIILLFWISWVWLKAHRGELHDDPVIFALKDKVSITCGFLLILSFVLASSEL